MGIGVVAYEMAGIVPFAQEISPFRPIHAHPANKESGLKFSPGKRSENALICLLPTHLWTYVNSRIVHRNRDLRTLRLTSVRRIPQGCGGTKRRAVQQSRRGSSYGCSVENVQERSPIHPGSMSGLRNERNLPRDFSFVSLPTRNRMI